MPKTRPGQFFVRRVPPRDLILKGSQGDTMESCACLKTKSTNPHGKEQMGTSCLAGGPSTGEGTKRSVKGEENGSWPEQPIGATKSCNGNRHKEKKVKKVVGAQTGTSPSWKQDS